MPAGHDMGHMQMGAGSQLIFNPAFGDQIYHTHPAGMWMLSYQYMHMDMSGLRDGTTDVDADQVGYMRNLEYEYMMIPTKMTMDMHMLMAMYGITDNWTVMVMPSYVETKMDMLMDMGPMMSKMGAMPSDPMNTGGLGDTEVRGSYKINTVLVSNAGRRSRQLRRHKDRRCGRRKRQPRPGEPRIGIRRPSLPESQRPADENELVHDCRTSGHVLRYGS